MHDNNLNVEENDQLQQLREKRDKLGKEISDIKCQISDVTDRINELQQEVDKNSQSDQKEKPILKEAFDLFNNAKYDDCFDRLLSEGLIPSKEPKDKATFVYNYLLTDSSFLDIDMLHAYLFKLKNKDILKEYIFCINTKGCTLLDSVRECFKKVHFKTAESDVIGRIYRYISESYFESNPEEAEKHFDTIGAAEFAAGAVVFLNTTLHNHNVRPEAKMSLEQFVEAGRSPDISPKGISREYMTELYNEIKRNPLQLTFNNQSKTGQNVTKQGYLYKEGGKYKTWKQRWFAICPDFIKYYVNPDDIKPRGIIYLSNLDVRKAYDSRKPFCFELVLLGKKDESIPASKSREAGGEHEKGKHKRYLMSAESEEERDAWIKAIRETLKVDMIYALLAMRESNRNP
jgi:cytohesin